MRRTPLQCANCGRGMARSPGSLPQGEATCRACRRIQPRQYRLKRLLGFCAHCMTPLNRPNQRKFCSRECYEDSPLGNRFRGSLTPQERRERLRAHRRNRTHVRREKVTKVRDLTIGAEIELRRSARKCRICGCWLTSKPYLSNSKELDHIVPLVMGGTHTVGNVRVICKRCNTSRPKDGSDFTGQVTLWAQVPELDGLPLFAKMRRKPKPRHSKDPSTVGWPSDRDKWKVNLHWYECRYCGKLGYNRKKAQEVCWDYECQRRRGREANDRWMVKNLEMGLRADGRARRR